MIVKCKSKWCLLDSKGKRILGTHRTKAQAKAQEAAININKARRAGHKIPRY